jgi:hypothetical protein
MFANEYLLCVQEDSLIMDTSEDGELSSDVYCPFELPDEEYGEMMFDRRLAMESSTSPVSQLAESRRGSTVADTDGKYFVISVLHRSEANRTGRHRTALFSRAVARPQVQSPISPIYPRNALVKIAGRNQQSRKGI